MTKILKKILTALFFGGVLAFSGLALRLFEGDTLQNFCDAFSLAGVALLSVACVGYLRAQDAFLGVGYAFNRVKTFFLPFLNDKKESYAEYRERKSEERESEKVGILPCIVAGLFYLGVACVLLTILSFLR